MELIKESARIEKNLGSFISQVTMEQDMIIPDNKPDVEELVLKGGRVTLENVRVMDGKAELNGKLVVNVMYKSSENREEEAAAAPMESFAGEIVFKETVQMPGVSQTDYVTPTWDLEDLRVRVLNSRKLTVSALVTFKMEACRDEEVELAEEIDEVDAESLEVDYVDKELEVLALAVRKKDMCRIREDVELGSNKPNIQSVLWKDMSITGVEYKLEEGKLKLTGDMLLFAIYKSEEEHIPVQWMEKSIPFSEEVDCPQAALGQIADVRVNISQTEVHEKPDYDGENRTLSLDAGLELFIRLYEEKNYRVIDDAYSPKAELVMETEVSELPHLLAKNNAKYKLSSKLNLPEGAGCLQICNSACTVRIENVMCGEDLCVEGSICVSLIYMSSDDAMPIKSMEETIPFTHHIEVENLRDGADINISPSLEQLSTVMLSAEEVEVRANIDLDAFVCEKRETTLIKQISTRPFDEAVLEAMPAMTGYVVKAGDTLWSIAKSFYTSIDSVRRYNSLTGDNLRPGEKLLIVKEGQL